jgi:hypothetical protein
VENPYATLRREDSLVSSTSEISIKMHSNNSSNSSRVGNASEIRLCIDVSHCKPDSVDMVEVGGEGREHLDEKNKSITKF